jgi:hypothetical protein
MQTDDIKINVNTEEVENAIDKAQQLSDTLEEIAPKFIIRGNENCTFNFYGGDKK